MIMMPMLVMFPPASVRWDPDRPQIHLLRGSESFPVFSGEVDEHHDKEGQHSIHEQASALDLLFHVSSSQSHFEAGRFRAGLAHCPVWLSGFL